MKIKVVKTKYWRPREDYLTSILESTKKLLRDNDVMVVSEKALSVARGNIVDESKVKQGLLAKVLARLFMRCIWGHFLGELCNFRAETIKRLRNYPLKEGAAHKQTVLRCSGFLQALKYGSEGGIDISNVPFSYACLPLKNPIEEAERIWREIASKVGKKITVIIADTDSTFSYRNFHFTSRPNPIAGIKSFGGAFSFILGRTFKIKQRATPLAVAGSKMSVEKTLHLVEVAHHARGYGAGRTIWDMSQRFRVNCSEVTWEMLDKVNHYPIVLIRRT